MLTVAPISTSNTFGFVYCEMHADYYYSYYFIIQLILLPQEIVVQAKSMQRPSKGGFLIARKHSI
jgi:hypothetical protein